MRKHYINLWYPNARTQILNVYWTKKINPNNRSNAFRQFIFCFLLIAIFPYHLIASSDKIGIGNFVWEDMDKDGQLDLGEPGISEVLITLYDANTNLEVSHTHSDENGLYFLEGIAKGYYYLSYTTSVKNKTKKYNSIHLTYTGNSYRSDNFWFDPSQGNDWNRDAAFYLACNSIDAGLDQVIILGEQVQLEVKGGNNYQWYPSHGLSCIDCPNPIARPNKSIYYVVHSIDENLCVQYDTVFVDVLMPKQGFEKDAFVFDKEEETPESFSSLILCEDFIDPLFDVLMVDEQKDKISYCMEMPFEDLSTYNIFSNNTLLSNIKTCDFIGDAALSLAGTSIELNQGLNHLVFIDVQGCKDSLTVVVGSVSPDTLNYTLEVNELDTFCINTDQLLGDIMMAGNNCDSSSDEFAMISMDDQTGCIIGEGIEKGKAKACIVICDDYVICDTTYLFINVVNHTNNQLIPEANFDVKHISIGEQLIFDPFENDQINGTIKTFYLVNQPLYGEAIFDQDEKLIYTPDVEYCDTENADKIDYAICNNIGCDTTSISVSVQCKDLAIYGGFSPNDDGQNDVFFIDGLQNFPEHNLKIFSRWGNIIYDIKNYQNDWKGIWEGEALPEGTYFYVLNDGNGNTYSGPLQINR